MHTDIASQWLVWSDELHCNVAVGHFHARQDEARADEAKARTDRVERGLLDPELDADVYGGNAGEHDAVESSGDSLARADEIAALESARKVVEVVDGVAFVGKLAHLTARPTDNPELLRAMQELTPTYSLSMAPMTIRRGCDGNLSRCCRQRT